MHTQWYYGLLQNPKLKMAAIMVAKIVNPTRHADQNG